MQIWLIFIIYVFMSAGGLFLIKTGVEGTSFGIQNSMISISLTPRLLIGFILYVASFLTSVYILSRMKLSLFCPIATGTVLVLTCLLGYFFLKEQIGMMQLLGIALILAGVIILNL